MKKSIVNIIGELRELIKDRKKQNKEYAGRHPIICAQIECLTIAVNIVRYHAKLSAKSKRKAKV
jgi:hypothetical protein